MNNSDANTMTDQELLLAAKADPQNFGLIYTRFNNQIKGFFINRLKDEAMSEDLTSQTFEKALKGIEKFTWEGVPISAWLQRIARNILIDYYRANTRHKTSNLPEDIQIADRDQISPDQQYEQEFSNARLQTLLQELPEKERKIVYLKFYYGYTNRVIADVTGLSESNVGTIIYRAIGKLREKLN